MPKRVVQLCSAHPSTDARVFQRTSVPLQEAGYEVHLIATDPAAQAYDHDGVTIHPIPHIDSSMARIKRRDMVANMAMALNPDVIHVHEPELLGATLARAGKTPVIYDVHELFFEVLRDRDWVPKPLRPVASTLWRLREQMLIRKCAGLIVVTDQVAEPYQKLRPDLVILPNYADLRGPLSLPKVERSGRDCIFNGTLDLNRGILQLIDAFGILRDRGVEARLLIAGKADQATAELMRARVCDLGLEEVVTLQGPYHPAEGQAMANAASIGVVPHLPSAGNNNAAWPVKLFEYLALGLPLVVSDLAPHHHLLDGHDVALFCDPRQHESIADQIQHLIEHPDEARAMGDRSRALAQSHYDWNLVRPRLLDLYNRILTRNG